MRTRLVAIAAVVVLATAGCTSHDPKPRSSPPAPSTQATTQASPTPSGPLTTGPGVLPGEKPPVLPAAANAHTSAGALLFATYFIQALDWSYATNNPNPLRQPSASSCQACQRYINAISDLRNQGGTERGARIHILSARLVTGNFRFKSDYVVQIDIRQDPAIISRPSSTPSTIHPDSPYVSLVFVSWITNRWSVIEVGAPTS